MSWSDQWATVLWVIWGPTPWAREDVVETLGPLMRPYFVSSQYPRIKTVTPKSKLDDNDEPVFTSGPLKGDVFEGTTDPDTLEVVDFGGPYLTGVKWNVHDKDGRKLTAKRMGEIRVAMRGGDVGFPKTPALPPKPPGPDAEEAVARKSGSIWPWIAAAVGAAGTVAAVRGAR